MDAKKYRERKTPVVCTSGEEFVMGRLSGTRVVELFEEAGVVAGSDVKMSPREALNLAIAVVPEAIEGVTADEVGDDTHLSVLELDFADLMDLFNTVLTASVGKEATNRAEGFRLPATAEGGSVDSSGVWTPADGSPSPPDGRPTLEPESSDLGP